MTTRTSTEEMNREIVEVLERESRERRALALLLDQALSKGDRLLVQQTEMGGTEAYVGSVSLQWLAGHVAYANALPLFQEKLEGGRVVIDEDTMEEVMQRPVDWSRMSVLAQYLASRPNHKFPPVLVVVYRPWVDDPKADEWGSDERAVKSVVEFESLDNGRKVGLLDISSDVTLFALDGQHRLMGIQGLVQELAAKGQIQPLNRDGKAVGGPLTLDDLGIDRVLLQKVVHERIGVEFISAVVAGETRTEARRRVRSIFVHVNRMAAPLSRSQLAQLDEDNGFAIVARKAAGAHDLFRAKSGRKPRVNFDSNTVATGSTVLTTLQALTEMADFYLRSDRTFAGWRPAKKGLVRLRPDEAELDQGKEEFFRFLESVASLPSLKELERGADTGEYRRFHDEKPAGKGHMLFRPIGQVALAQAIGILHYQRGLALDVIFKRLAEFDARGGFEMDSGKSLWFGVLYDPVKKRVMTSRRDLAADLLVYLAGGGVKDEAERAKLRDRFNAAREIQDQKMDINGAWVPVATVVELPPVL